MAAVLVDITPDVSLLRKSGQAGHSVADAVAELVDNSLDARVGNEAIEVCVSYSASQGWIEVLDNGTGMSQKELSSAMVLGHSGKSRRDIGKFGLGMKAACTALGCRFVIESVRESDKRSSIVRYDEDQFLSRGAWLIEVERRNKRFERGTLINVESKRIYPGLSASLTRNLGSTFRHFIDAGDLTIFVNGVPVSTAAPNIIPGSRIEFEGHVDDSPIYGWCGLLEVSSQRGWYGFSLVRNKRIIRRHEKIGFQPHPAVARIVGEIHLDDFPTNNLKTDFIRETEGWRDLERFVSAAIAGPLESSKRMAKARASDTLSKRLISDLNLLTPLIDRETRVEDGLDGIVDIVVGSKIISHSFRRLNEVDYASFSARSETHLSVESNTRLMPGFDSFQAAVWAIRNVAEILVLDAPRPDVERVGLISSVMHALLSDGALLRRLAESHGVEVTRCRPSAGGVVT